jgi:hypothetical protein
MGDSICKDLESNRTITSLPPGTNSHPSTCTVSLYTQNVRNSLLIDRLSPAAWPFGGDDRVRLNFALFFYILMGLLGLSY